MNKTNRITLKLAIGSSAAIAINTVFFVIALITTYHMDTWNGIENYAEHFEPVSLLTVIPSMLLAVSYLIFTVSVHYLTDVEHKIWSHLAMNFGLVYITISTANYLIQIISVMPSIQNHSLAGLDIIVAGYPYSIFYALMASYFFMCISLFNVALVFPNHIKVSLFIASLLCIACFIMGVLTHFSGLQILGALCWICGTIVGIIQVMLYYVKRL